jgi:2-haloacid dehalogenase
VRRSRYDAVLFDLLTALLDSWSLWNAVAGDAGDGRRWRAEYLRITYATGAYRPYEDLVAEAAEAAGLDRRLATALEAHYDQLQPCPAP